MVHFEAALQYQETSPSHPKVMLPLSEELRNALSDRSQGEIGYGEATSPSHPTEC